MKKFKIEIERHEFAGHEFFMIREKHYAFGFLRVVNDLHPRRYDSYEDATIVADRYRKMYLSSKTTFIEKVTEIIG